MVSGVIREQPRLRIERAVLGELVSRRGEVLLAPRRSRVPIVMMSRTNLSPPAPIESRHERRHLLIIAPFLGLLEEPLDDRFMSVCLQSAIQIRFHPHPQRGPMVFLPLVRQRRQALGIVQRKDRLDKPLVARGEIFFGEQIARSAFGHETSSWSRRIFDCTGVRVKTLLQARHRFGFKMLDVSRINRRTFLTGAALAATGCMSKIVQGIDALEESPDRRELPEFLEHSIKVITDDDLFAALDLGSSGLKQVRDAVESRDFSGAYHGWG